MATRTNYPFPDKIEAFCEECGWKDVLYRKDLSEGVMGCPECKEHILMKNSCATYYTPTKKEDLTDKALDNTNSLILLLLYSSILY